jgi:hypothetical protein
MKNQSVLEQKANRAKLASRITKQVHEEYLHAGMMNLSDSIEHLIMIGRVSKEAVEHFRKQNKFSQKYARQISNFQLKLVEANVMTKMLKEHGKEIKETIALRLKDELKREESDPNIRDLDTTTPGDIHLGDVW